MKVQIKTYLFIFAILIVSGCNVTKHVPDGNYLLNKINIHTDVTDITKDNIHEYLRQTPNEKVFGVLRMQLGIYNLSGKDTTKWLNKTFRKIGDEPVLYDEDLTLLSKQQIQRLYENKGYINAKVDSKVTKKGKKVTLDYTIKSNKPYSLRNYTININNAALFEIASDTSRSLIKPNMLFNSDILNLERERVSTLYRQQGYYNFNKEYLVYNADSALKTHKVDITLDLRDYIKQTKDSSSSAIFKQFTIRKVIYYTNSEANLISDLQNVSNLDTIRFRDFLMIGAKKQLININALIQNTYINPNTLYNDVSVEKTYSALNSLGPIKYVNISFKEVQNNILDCYVIIVPSKAISVSTDIEGTFTDGFWGLGGNLGFVNRNTFNGAETLSLQGRGALEWQNNVLARELGAQVGLKFPNFLMPFLSYDTKRNLHANTEFQSSINYQFRPGEFTTTNVGSGIKYSWTRAKYRHIFDLLDVNYVYFPYVNPEFEDRYINTGRYNKYNYEDHFIMRMGYSSSFSGFNANRPMRDYSTTRYSIESAGNLLYAINKLANTPLSTDGSYKLFNTRYSQYIRMEYNSTYHQIIDKNNRFVYHVGAGLGIPYGNADLIPYERRFYSGGANSVRGWSESTLGPGIYQRIDAKTRDYNQVGDLKLDLNMEYRAKMFWVLEGALFLDAGNIWTIRDYSEQSGGLFKLDTFMNQIAIAYGVGFRMDFSFFIFRFDIGSKLYNPMLTRREQWRMKLSYDDMAFHIAIGYPF